MHDGIQVLFTTGPDFDPQARQGYGLIDAATGEVLYESTTIPEEDLDAGYAGGGVWGTPTVDPRDRLPVRRHVEPRVQDPGARLRRRDHQARPRP